jgi:hypothetical protein
MRHPVRMQRGPCSQCEPAALQHQVQERRQKNPPSPGQPETTHRCKTAANSRACTSRQAQKAGPNGNHDPPPANPARAQPPRPKGPGAGCLPGRTGRSAARTSPGKSHAKTHAPTLRIPGVGPKPSGALHGTAGANGTLQRAAKGSSSHGSTQRLSSHCWPALARGWRCFAAQPIEGRHEESE